MKFTVFKNIISSLLCAVYPPKCVICDEILVQDEKHICKTCDCRINVCSYVQSIKDFETENASVKCLSLFKYEGLIKRAVWKFKFRGYKDYSCFFANIMAKEIKNKFRNIKFDFICSVPLFKTRERERGYNQSECLARLIAQELSLEHKTPLMKTCNNSVQHRLDISHRKENVKGVYALKSGENIRGKTVLLCDDIITTGNTVGECAKILLNGGACRVFVCTVAYVP